MVTPPRTFTENGIETAIQRIIEEIERPLSPEERKTAKAGIVYVSPNILDSTKLRQRCYFDGYRLQVDEELTGADKQQSTCPHCYRVYWMPLSPERQRELDEARRTPSVEQI